MSLIFFFSFLSSLFISHWGIDGGEEDVGLEGSRGYFSRILASEKYRKGNDRELLVDLSFREGEATCCLVHV